MDFTRNETQAAVAEAVAGALTTAAPAEDLLTALPSRSVDEAGYDERLWAAFAGSGLLSLGLQERVGPRAGGQPGCGRCAGYVGGGPCPRCGAARGV